MQKPKITFLNHASFIVENNNIKLLVDPYLFGSAFNNGWSLLTEVDHTKQLDKITHIFYSHEHPDHFSIPFLKKIEISKRKNITILYQQTYDKRVKIFCEKLGYKFMELKNNFEVSINNNFSLIIGKVPFYDSWINFNINGTNILNVNDCVLENPNIVLEIKGILQRKIDVLFTQFSYANFINEEDQETRALKQLKKIKIQDKVLQPTYIIPFASFVYFSHVENKFMNENINSIKETFNYLTKNCSAKTIILSPNEEWILNNKENHESLKYWNDVYENINNMNFSGISRTLSTEQLIIESKKYINRVKKMNNFFLIKILYYLGLFPSISIYINDQKIFFKFSIMDGLKISRRNNDHYFISLSSENLSFIYNYDFGFDTLQVNARLKCNNNYFKKVTKCFLIGSLNNTGRYIKISNFHKFLNFNFLIRGLEILNLKKKYY